MIGKKSHRLTVIGPSKKAKSGRSTRTLWKCKCECGNESWVVTNAINKRLIKSCGCWAREVSRASCKARNIVLPLGVAAKRQVISAYKSDARRHGKKWELAEEQATMLFEGDCHYCGSPPSNVHNNPNLNGNYTYNGIDKIIPSIGYVIENCVSCCFQCNRAKSDHSQQDFIEHARRIVAHQDRNEKRKAS